MDTDDPERVVDGLANYVTSLRAEVESTLTNDAPTDSEALVNHANATPLSALSVTATDMHRVAVEYEAWVPTTEYDGAAWANMNTGEVVVQRSAPAGVPDSYRYIPPAQVDYWRDKGHEIVQSPQGGNYMSPSPTLDGDDGGGAGGDDATPEEALAEFEDKINGVGGLITRQNRSDLGMPTKEAHVELWNAASEAVGNGADPTEVAGAIGDRLEEAEGYSAFFSTDEIMGRYARKHYEDDDPAVRDLAERMHDYAEHPDDYPDVPERDTDPFAGGDADLRGDLADGVTSDNLYETFTPRYNEGQETFDQLEQYVDNGGDPAEAVLTAAGAHDDVTLEDEDREDVASDIAYDFMYGDDLPDGEAGEALQQELRKFYRDPEDYPRELSADRRAVMDELEGIVEDQRDDRRGPNTVGDMSWFDLRNNNVNETVADLVAGGADPGEVAGALDEHVDGDNRANFYARAASEVGARDTDRGKAEYLAGNQSPARQNARDEFLDERVTDAEESQWFDARSEWFGDVYGDDTAPLFQMAAERTENEQIPDEAPDVLSEGSESEEAADHREVYEKASEHTTEVLRDVYGNEMTVYRGLSPEGMPSATGSTDISRQIERAADSGRPAELEHRTLESWSANPLHARKFAGAGDDEPDGVVLKRQIDVEDAVTSSYSGQLSANEDEVVVAHDESAEYDPEQVITADELRSGDDAAELLRQARAFATTDDQDTTQSARPVTMAQDTSDDDDERDGDGDGDAPVRVAVDDLPAINWLHSLGLDGDGGVEAENE